MREPAAAVRRARPWIVALIVVGGVAIGLLGNELLRRLPSFGREEAPPSEPASPSLTIEPVRLGSLSTPDGFELGLAAALAALRLALPLFGRRRALEPLLDLPLMGVLLAVSGGGFSPLDPALPLAYVAAIVFLRGTTPDLVPAWQLTLELLIGLGAIHVIAERHDRLRLAAGEAAQIARLKGAIVASRVEFDTALASVETPLESSPGPEAIAASAAGRSLAPGTIAAFGEMRDRLAEAQRRFGEMLALLTPDVDAERLGEAKDRWQGDLDAIYDRFFRARESWLEARPPPSLALDASSLDALRETQWNVRQELLRQVDDFEEAFIERDRLRSRQQALRRSSTARRAAMFGALLLFGAVAVVLRDRLSAAVRASEEARARQEVELAEREKEHWIALTAGLTHGLGNDILAYDVYFSELSRLLADPAVAAPARARELLAFLSDSNRGRLGFLQFLDAFARHRQAAAGDAPPIRFVELDLPELVARVRKNLAQVEIADLPREGSDPAVDRQIRLLRDLPLEVRVGDASARTLRRGHRGIVEFFVYELVKNALRSATGERPLVATLARAGDRLEISIENDVQVEPATGSCPRCGREGPLRRVRRRRDAPPACERCFAAALQELLDASFQPGKGSGTGLGLFLIRYFLGAFWKGEIRARVVDAAVPTVAFTLSLPDPAAGASTPAAPT